MNDSMYSRIEYTTGWIKVNKINVCLTFFSFLLPSFFLYITISNFWFMYTLERLRIVTKTQHTLTEWIGTWIWSAYIAAHNDFTKSQGGYVFSRLFTLKWIRVNYSKFPEKLCSMMVGRLGRDAKRRAADYIHIYF